MIQQNPINRIQCRAVLMAVHIILVERPTGPQVRLSTITNFRNEGLRTRSSSLTQNQVLEIA